MEASFVSVSGFLCAFFLLLPFCSQNVVFFPGLKSHFRAPFFDPDSEISRDISSEATFFSSWRKNTHTERQRHKKRKLDKEAFISPSYDKSTREKKEALCIVAHGFLSMKARHSKTLSKKPSSPVCLSHSVERGKNRVPKKAIELLQGTFSRALSGFFQQLEVSAFPPLSKRSLFLVLELLFSLAA